ncbi:MAG: 4Fe-4S binding protein [Bacteroidaceae bacterium]|nr:4Fe-4S binding protein [Bacteroidaceae bacterium]
MLKKVRIALAAIFFLCITGLFLDFTGTMTSLFGWMAKLQFLPAVLGLSIIPIVIVLALTLLLGRIYCSVICPMGVFQDIVAWISCLFKKKNPYSYSKPKTWLRLTVLVAFIILLVAGFNGIALLLAPYSAYGRIVNGLLQPLYIIANNFFAGIAEENGSYAVYAVDPHLMVTPLLIVAFLSFAVIVVCACIGGRTYCNTICPVGTVLGYAAKFSWLKPVIDKHQCIGCNKCAKNCKASAILIDKKNGNFTIDYTRCVTCGNCLQECPKDAIAYCHPYKQIPHPTPEADEKPAEKVDTNLRNMITTAVVLGASAAVKAQEMKLDGGYAEIEDKVMPERKTKIVPPGAISANNLAQHCTGCQLCVSNCPNNVLRPSTSLDSFLQPYSSYENGYCRPECTKCSEVCPAGAIKPIAKEEKSSTQIGHAVVVVANCLATTKEFTCGNCERHCPTGAIQMVVLNKEDEGKRNAVKIPVVDEERCIGCGACENLCPSRPLSAIYVEGHEVHKTI